MMTTSDFEYIVTQNTPLIDVRAPIEFQKGAFLNAINLPLMNDEERHMVGICYKEKGQTEAVDLGHRLVSGDTKQLRINSWVSFIEKYPNSMIYCFRGGMRSQISQQWIYEATGKEILRLKGGYKAFRNYLIQALEPEAQRYKPILLSGFTGSGKTLLLKKIVNAVDLEGIANHRGSSFGGFITPQPNQINFENNLAYNLIRLKNKGFEHVIFEDESANIGKSYIPRSLYEYIKSGQLVLMEVPFEKRVAITFEEYVVESQKHYIEAFGEEVGLDEWAKYMRGGISRVKKRLGGELYKDIMVSFEKAYTNQSITESTALHQSWIERILEQYYDRMYEYQIQKNQDKIIFRGDEIAVLQYLTAIG